MIKYFEDYISPKLLNYLKKQWKPVKEIPGLTEVGTGGGLENEKSLKFLCDLYLALRSDLEKVLTQRQTDREFLDSRTKANFELNKTLHTDFLSPDYQTVLGHEDGNGRIVMGPKNNLYAKAGGGKPIAPLPDYLKGHHVTLFGPPDDPKLSINAMNGFHRKLKDEPAIVAEILKNPSSLPKWGADDEDSKTPLRSDLVSAGVNLTGCFDGNIEFTDPKNQKTYRLEKTFLSLPIKRFPGLALPSLFLFLDEEPMPLHLYDFALHIFQNWHNPKALAFYVPKLENEEEARYIHAMVKTAEKMIQDIHPEYKLGTVKLFIVLENPRAIFRVNEIMDELYPYFAGASLGWHDYLASTARLFKEDGNYRIPVKADPHIVIKYIKASHSLLSEVVGKRGGVKIGGMYGVLPQDNDLKSDSFQITIKGFIKDVVTQMKRDLSGFWVAHPDFVRIGVALTEAWKSYAEGKKENLETLVTSLLVPKFHKEILDFIKGPDLAGLDIEDVLYPRSLLVADIKESNFIANNHPDEIRFNVFQSLQYLTDWLSGNGCVALPAQIDGVPVRVMDDLATAERSRWEVWHELYHGRFSIDEFLKIAHEEYLFIRKDLSNSKKIVQVKWDTRTEKWYPIAFKLMIKLMTDDRPVEFASELLLPFTIETIRSAHNPWEEVLKVDSQKYTLKSYIEKFNEYFSICGSISFAKELSPHLTLDESKAEKLIKSFSLEQVIETASFHGDIGEDKKTLDEVASKEQSLVLNEDASIKKELRDKGQQYLKTFGFKFLISAQGKTGKELLESLKHRTQNTIDQELENAKTALWEISQKRFQSEKKYSFNLKLQNLLKKHQIPNAQIAITTAPDSPPQLLCLGENTTSLMKFQIASLSKSIGSAFAITYFHHKGVTLDTSVNSLLEKTKSTFRLKGEFAQKVTLIHLMNHTALNLHYVNGVPSEDKMPDVRDLLEGNKAYDYESIKVLGQPGKAFHYSGAGFLILEHLLEAMENKSIQELTKPFLECLGLKNLSFEQTLIKSDKHFPAFAAGAVSTADDISLFLKAMTRAYHDASSDQAIQHEAAVRMLFAENKGSYAFMKAGMGLGVFVMEAGPNRWMLHQGANDGFRSLMLHCFQGPDIGKGLVALCNANLPGVYFIAEAAQIILEELKISGVDFELFQKDFNFKNIPTEQVVNIGYKELVFNAFQNDLPEEIMNKGPKDPLGSYNLAVNGRIISVSNQRFARAENLLSSYLPIFDPELYGRQGKIMDSWESVRHNQEPADTLEFELKTPSKINYVSLSTQYHSGNHPQAVQIEGRSKTDEAWQILVPATELAGHSLKNIKLHPSTTVYEQIKVSIFPDGGLTRLGLYAELPSPHEKKFSAIENAQNISFSDPIPHPKKPLTPDYNINPKQVEANWAVVTKGQQVDVASLAYGGYIISASNEHYSPATQVISPYPPINMFDGSESARSREKNHFEEVVIGIQKVIPIERIEIDFTYFRNNNPFELSLESLELSSSDLPKSKDWKVILPKTPVKAYAGNKMCLDLKKPSLISQFKIKVYPDGGINRIRLLGRKP